LLDRQIALNPYNEFGVIPRKSKRNNKKEMGSTAREEGDEAKMGRSDFVTSRGDLK
jgi:hypothetical protein